MFQVRHETRYFELVGEPDEIAGAVDVDALLDRVLDTLATPSVDREAVHTTLRRDPCRIRVASGKDVRAVIEHTGTACEPLGVCLSPRQIWVVRLDWPGLLAHEITHVVQRLLRQHPGEAEAARVADACA